MVARRIAWSASLALLAVAGATLPHGFAQARSTPAHSAQAFKHYTNPRAHYTISYPTSWKVVSTNGLDLFVGAPDHRAFLSANATAVGGAVSAAEIRQQQKAVLLSLHAGANTITYATRRIHGVAFQVAEAVARKDGKSMDVILVDSLYRGYIFDFNAGVVLKTPTTAADTTLLRNSLNSVTLKP